MKFYMLKNYLAAIAILTAVSSMQAQFDDVYYDPDTYVPIVKNHYTEPAPAETYTEGEDGVTYYDDSEYGYYDEYDDYDYYYSSRIKRFYHPYVGFGFYDPVYVGYNYYDPFAWDYYAYPGANIYFSFGLGFSFGFGAYWGTPAPFYYGYNDWYYPSYAYWGGCGGYYPYGNYYNPYYPPYYGGGCGGGYYPPHDDHHGGHDDYYYGPRVTGNTGSSPRGPVTNPGVIRPGSKETDVDVTDANDRPSGLPEPGTPGRVTPSGSPVVTSPDHTPATPSPVRQDAGTGVVKQVPVDKELPRDQATPSPKRPVFRPDVEKYQPYPTPERTKPMTPQAGTDSPSGRPSGAPKDNFQPYPGGNQTDKPTRTDQLPDYTPPSRGSQDRPSYSPPPRHNDAGQQSAPRTNDRPSYSPPSRQNDESRSESRPSYSPPSRSYDNQRSSNDRPSYSPSSSGRSSSSGGGGGNSSSRPSGGGGSSSHQSSSPRGKG